MAIPRSKTPERRRLFAHHFLAGAKGVRGSAEKAAVAAGYKDGPGLRQVVLNLKADPDVQAEFKRHFDRFDLTDEKIIAEYYRIAFANVMDLLKHDPATGEYTLDTLTDLPLDLQHAIAEVKPVIDPTTGATRSYAIKMHDKKGALDFLAKVRGLIRSPDINITLVQLMANLNLSLYTTDDLRTLGDLLRRGLPPMAPAPLALPPGTVQPMGGPKTAPPTTHFPRNGHAP